MTARARFVPQTEAQMVAVLRASLKPGWQYDECRVCGTEAIFAPHVVLHAAYVCQRCREYRAGEAGRVLSGRRAKAPVPPAPLVPRLWKTRARATVSSVCDVCGLPTTRHVREACDCARNACAGGRNG